MGSTLPLLSGRISLEEAVEKDVDMTRELSYPQQRLQFWLHLYAQRKDMSHLVSRHLNIPPSDFIVGGVEEWIHGSFNACIPIRINRRARTSHLPPYAIIRFPLPFKVGEWLRPGNSDEKLRTEAATYVWLQQNCPDIPIPRLLGFGFPGKQSFTTLEIEPFYKRIAWYVRRAVAWISGRTLAPYAPHDRCLLLKLEYLLVECVDDGRLLSESWEKYRHDPKRRANLFKGLSQIMVRLAKLPLPRIGSWTLDDGGFLKLRNRPLTLLLHQLENADISTGIPRDRTYTSVEPYALDLIGCQDSRMRHQPNSIRHQIDGERHLAALTAMRAVLPKFTHRRFREGPFVLSLTDLDQGNIFIDDDWNITRIIDLEWACAQPIEMMGPPDWLSSRSLEEITSNLDEFASLHEEFVDTVEREELAPDGSSSSTADTMRACWATGTYW